MLLVSWPTLALSCEVMIPRRPPVIEFKHGELIPKRSAVLKARVKKLAPGASDPEFGDTLGAIIVEWNVEPDVKQQRLDQQRADQIVSMFIALGVPKANIHLRPLDAERDVAAFTRRRRSTIDSFQVRSAECGDGTFI